MRSMLFALSATERLGPGAGLRARGAEGCGRARVMAFTAHGLFVSGAEAALAEEALERVVVTDSVPAFRLADPAVLEKVEVLSAAPLLAEGVRRLITGAETTDLLAY